MKNRYAGQCERCGGRVPAGAGTVESRNGRWVVYHDECPEITSGFGMGGAGSDDHNMGLERDPWHELNDAPAGAAFAPTGTTEGVRTPGRRCQRCGAPANYNPNCASYLCDRHWDEY